MKKIILVFILVQLWADSQVNAQEHLRQGATSNHHWRWEEMKPGDLELALEELPVAYLVVSPLEWHGEAMAFGTDPAIGAKIGEMAWEATGGVLIPTLYIGSETEYKDWTSTGLTSFWGLEWNTKEVNPGSLYISNMVFELVMRDMLASVERNGFKACVVVTGHGATEYIRILKSLEERYMEGRMKVIFSDLAPVERPEEITYAGSGGHADFAEASNLGAVDPAMVDKSKFGKGVRDRKIELLEENTGLIDYDKGEIYLQWRAERIIKTVQKFLADLEK